MLFGMSGETHPLEGEKVILPVIDMQIQKERDIINLCFIPGKAVGSRARQGHGERGWSRRSCKSLLQALSSKKD